MDLPRALSLVTWGCGIQNYFSSQTEMSLSLLKKLRGKKEKKKKLRKILKENTKEEMKAYSKRQAGRGSPGGELVRFWGHCEPQSPPCPARHRGTAGQDSDGPCWSHGPFLRQPLAQENSRFGWSARSGRWKGAELPAIRVVGEAAIPLWEGAGGGPAGHPSFTTVGL